MSNSTTIIVGDCLETMRGMPDASVHAIVTDPPYGISFMGKGWDSDVPPVAVWAECLRVLKPGGHLLAFAGTRTQHRMCTRIEDAGFEIRDLIAWVYGSGFPKSLDVSKAIDKVNGEAGRLHKFTGWMRTTGLTGKEINEATGTFMGSHYLTAGSQPAIPTPELWGKLRPMCGAIPLWVDALVDRVAAEREVVGTRKMHDTRKARAGFSGKTHSPDYDGSTRIVGITAPATDAARHWQGWGTALKPAMEPITVARKPLVGTVAANVMAHGTGGINVDGCRVGTDGATTRSAQTDYAESGWRTGHRVMQVDAGRWPANLIHDGSADATAPFPGSSATGTLFGEGEPTGAARFFYCAKPSRAERGANSHPTVKPIALMRYLCRLVTPKGGKVLDPFAGSGTTGVAAIAEGFDFVGCELSEDYAAIARKRLESYGSTIPPTDRQAAAHTPAPGPTV